jgi:hypothetical protein
MAATEVGQGGRRGGDGGEGLYSGRGNGRRGGGLPGDRTAGMAPSWLRKVLTDPSWQRPDAET